ncbi:DsrE family protein [Shewanella donghaensis]|uniref:DsrE family protein n=1 Tax=Shewanella donghaensis TaxID=238836 RepID=UPI001181F3C9|nr:DsrE family protein [Shewanella donghaensis]
MPTSITLKLIFLSLLLAFSSLSHAGKEAFKSGTAIKDYGQIAVVDSQLAIPKDMVFKVAFDMSKAAKPAEINRSLNTLARFINMHEDAGVPAKNIHLAMVVHGNAVGDLAKNEFYRQQHGLEAPIENANKALIKQLTQYGVKIYICGQSAAYYNLDNEALLPGVDMALSAMTAHAILAEQGFTLNPF